MSFKQEVVGRCDVVMLIRLNTLLSVVQINPELLELRQYVMIHWDLVHPHNNALCLTRPSLQKPRMFLNILRTVSLLWVCVEHRLDEISGIA